ncbi:hypothetical protein [Endozoicomonas sp. SCSIO W0465]|uniref:hypothetical protein n=1 Tax=Endozoicomonas sp. SCSIO W0465 TaxID=2918516 RepID=UPI00207649A6|nr:hypothetical protein [Endozoicomonas sp. SCSIO W0465]USE33893.1 hypothetical protein MJO57_17115 [Endozoicomonas sp. SCSIO W0465]
MIPTETIASAIGEFKSIKDYVFSERYNPKRPIFNHKWLITCPTDGSVSRFLVPDITRYISKYLSFSDFIRFSSINRENYIALRQDQKLVAEVICHDPGFCRYRFNNFKTVSAESQASECRALTNLFNGTHTVSDSLSIYRTDRKGVKREDLKVVRVESSHIRDHIHTGILSDGNHFVFIDGTFDYTDKKTIRFHLGFLNTYIGNSLKDIIKYIKKNRSDDDLAKCIDGIVVIQYPEKWHTGTCLKEATDQ